MDWGAVAAYALFLAILIGLFIFFRKTRHLVPQIPLMRDEEPKARLAEGTVTHFFEHTGGDLDTSRVRGDLRTINIQVHVPDGPDYITSATWQIQHGHRNRLQEGMKLPVKVHHERRDILFPAVNWIEMREAEFAQRMMSKPDDVTIRPKT